MIWMGIIKKCLADDKYVIKIKNKLNTRNSNANKWFVIHERLLFRRTNTNANQWKIYIPQSILEKFIEYYHTKLGHPGVNRLYRYITDFSCTSKFKTAIKLITRTCDICQRVKSNNRNNRGLCFTDVPKHLLSKCYVDLFGPLDKTIMGLEYILIIVEAFS